MDLYRTHTGLTEDSRRAHLEFTKHPQTIANVNTKAVPTGPLQGPQRPVARAGGGEVTCGACRSTLAHRGQS